MNSRMTARERMIWEQAVRVLRRNSTIATVTVEPLEAQRILAKAASQRRRA
jgi:hypothetical protein